VLGTVRDQCRKISKLEEFNTPERTLAADNSGLELDFEIDFQRAVTPCQDYERAEGNCAFRIGAIMDKMDDVYSS
jgi:hypothetical protein